MKDIGKLWLVLFLAALGCCQGNKLTPTEYLRFFEKHQEEFSSVISRNGISVTTCYLPPEYYASREAVQNPGSSIDSILKRYANTIYIKVLFQPVVIGKQNSMIDQSQSIQRELGDWVVEAAKNFDELFELASVQDTIRPTNCNAIRGFSISNSDGMLVSFARNELKSDVRKQTFVMRIGYRSIGTVNIDMRALTKKCPTLK